MYNFKQVTITNIHKKIFSNDDIHYIWKDVDFLYKHRENNKKIVICFHGAVSNASPHTFRGFNYSYPDTDILCLSDLMIKKYHKTKKISLSWYLSTSDHNHFPIYKQIFDNIFKRKKYTKILFYGSSGGGHPALVFSSLYSKPYKAECLLSNSQIYLPKYSYFPTLLDHLEIKEEDINLDIEKHILKYGSPEKVHLYTNQRDENHYTNHALPFSEFMNKNFKGKIILNIFIGPDPAPNKTNHHVRFPNNTDDKTYIQKYL